MPKLLPSEMKFSRWGKTPKDPSKRAKRKEIEGQAILTSELLTMERQTEPPIKERKTYLKEEEMGNAAVHSSPEKNHGQRKLKTGEREVS